MENTARLPSGPQVNKHTELTPDPEDLARVAYCLTVKPSGVVVMHDRRGQVVARYFDEEFAREEVEAAGLKWDELLAVNRLKAEQLARTTARRQHSPNRRLRAQRRAEREGKKKEKGEAAAA